MSESKNVLQELVWGEYMIINDHVGTVVEDLIVKNPGYRLPSYDELLEGLNEDPSGFSLGVYVVGEGHDLFKYYDLSTRQFVTSPTGTVRCRLVK